jgi:hypothetical protein
MLALFVFIDLAAIVGAVLIVDIVDVDSNAPVHGAANSGAYGQPDRTQDASKLLQPIQ